MLAGVECHEEVCDCSNSDGQFSQYILNAANQYEHDCLFFCNQETAKCQGYVVGKNYQKLNNVCRKGSINSDHLANSDSFSQERGKTFGSNSTSVGTQTSSVHDVNIQTTQSFESLTESPSDKFKPCSHIRLGNYINYSRLYTKASSIESSVKDESTQYDSYDSENKSTSQHHTKKNGSRITCCCEHDPFHAKSENFSEKNWNAKHKRRKLQQNNDSFYYHPGIESIFPINFMCPQYPHFPYHVPLLCNCYAYSKLKCVNEFNKDPFGESSEDFVSDLPKKETIISQNKNSSAEGTAVLQNFSKFDVVDEKKSELSKNVEIKFKKIMRKAKSDNSLNLDIEQRKPLLENPLPSSPKQKMHEKFDSRVEFLNGHKLNDEENVAECRKTAPECVSCSASPEIPSHTNCIQIRQTPKKSSKKTSPLKVITFALFASAFFITGSAIKDAYY